MLCIIEVKRYNLAMTGYENLADPGNDEARLELVSSYFDEGLHHPVQEFLLGRWETSGFTGIEDVYNAFWGNYAANRALEVAAMTGREPEPFDLHWDDPFDIVASPLKIEPGNFVELATENIGANAHHIIARIRAHNDHHHLDELRKTHGIVYLIDHDGYRSPGKFGAALALSKINSDPRHMVDYDPREDIKVVISGAVTTKSKPGEAPVGIFLLGAMGRLKTIANTKNVQIPEGLEDLVSTVRHKAGSKILRNILTPGQETIINVTATNDTDYGMPGDAALQESIDQSLRMAAPRKPSILIGGSIQGGDDSEISGIGMSEPIMHDPEAEDPYEKAYDDAKEMQERIYTGDVRAAAQKMLLSYYT